MKYIKTINELSSKVYLDSAHKLNRDEKKGSRASKRRYKELLDFGMNRLKYENDQSYIKNIIKCAHFGKFKFDLDSYNITLDNIEFYLKFNFEIKETINGEDSVELQVNIVPVDKEIYEKIYNPNDCREGCFRIFNIIFKIDYDSDYFVDDYSMSFRDKEYGSKYMSAKSSTRADSNRLGRIIRKIFKGDVDVDFANKYISLIIGKSSNTGIDFSYLEDELNFSPDFFMNPSK